MEYRQHVPESNLTSDGLKSAEHIVRQNLSASASATDSTSEYYDEVSISLNADHVTGCGGNDHTGMWVCGSLARDPQGHEDSTPQGHGKAAKIAPPKILSPDEYEEHMATKNAVQRGQ